ncbi:solute carrier family 22 member 6-A-like [Mytilus galloprovincialis]|uniref:solute carrier family 22 member 6-A-like n=1 Tax=Mytilus galloprovincialis TaxID=29158 RepID=UPI003F7BAFD9
MHKVLHNIQIRTQMTDLNEYLEETIDNIGGLGRFQWIIIVLLFGSNISDNWSNLMMAYGAAVPNWRCDMTSLEGLNFTKANNISDLKICEFKDNSISIMCKSRLYDPGMSTVVSEWDLVCDKSWVPSTITTLQMGGLITGGFVSGHVADAFGRKSTYVCALFTIISLNVAAAFSSTWEMFAVFRFFIGLGSGFTTSLNFTFVIEFTPRQSRSMLRFLPCRELFGMLYACLCWWLHDWRYIQIGSALSVFPYFLGIVWFVPESFRWLVTHWKIRRAYDVIKTIASMNNKKPPEYDKFHEEVIQIKDLVSEEKKYSVLDLLDNPRLLKITLLLMVAWFSGGYGTYGIFFGVQQLGGNIYLNLILLNAIGLFQVTGWYFANCIGRRWTTSMFYIIGGCSGIIVGLLQALDIENKETFVTVFALPSKAFVTAGWVSVMLITAEIYPTVVRNIGSGLLNATSGFGIMVAPIVNFASQKIPGLLYLIFAGLMSLSAFLVILLPETNNIALEDTIDFDPNNSMSRKIKNSFNTTVQKGYEYLK